MTTKDNPSRPLPDMFHEWAVATVDEDGFPITHALIRDREGLVTVAALDLEAAQAYAFMLKCWDDGASEMIFALDRYALPEQGTTLNDVLGGFHFTRDAAPRPFIIEYQHKPRIVHPIVWDNPFWTAGLYGEFTQVLRQRLGIAPAPTTTTPGGHA